MLLLVSKISPVYVRRPSISAIISSGSSHSGTRTPSSHLPFNFSISIIISLFFLCTTKGTNSRMSSCMLSKFCAVGVIIFAFIIVPFSSTAYSCHKVPLGTSIAPNPIAGFVLSLSNFSFFISSLSQILTEDEGFPNHPKHVSLHVPVQIGYILDFPFQSKT